MITKELLNKNADELTLQEKIQLIKEADALENRNAVAEEMAEMLRDEYVTTYDMISSIELEYTEDKSDDYRAGFDRACQILLWKSAPEIAQDILLNVGKGD